MKTGRYPVEIYDMWQYMCAKVYKYEPIFRCRIDFCGHLNVAALRQAVTATLRMAPQFGCRYDDSGCRPYWIDNGLTGDDMVVEISADDDSEATIVEAFTRPIDPATGPQQWISVVRQPHGDTLCFVVNHMICDAAGYHEYLYLLGHLYTLIVHGQELPPLSPGPRQAELLLHGLSFFERRRIVRSQTKLMTGADNPDQTGIDLREGKEKHVYMVTRTMPPDQVEVARAFAKAHGATFNDLMMTLYARGFCRIADRQHIQIPATINLRKFIRPDRKYGLSNFTEAVLCMVDVKPEDDLTTTLAQVRDQMLVYKSGNEVLKGTIAWTLMVLLNPYRKLFEKFPSLHKIQLISFSNLGVLDADRLSFDDLPITAAYLMPSIKGRPAVGMDISTYRNQCWMTSNLTGGELDHQFAVAVMDHIFAELDKL